MLSSHWACATWSRQEAAAEREKGGSDKAFGDRQKNQLAGGFHLLDADRRRLQLTIETLHLLPPDHIIPCHCTG